VTTKAGDRRTAGTKDHAGHPDSSITIRLFDADRTDATLELGPALRRRLTVRQLLWIDVEGQLDGAAADIIGRKMRLKSSTREALERPTGGPYIALHGLYFHIRIATEADHDPSESPRWLDLLAAGNVVLSSHQEPIDLVKQLDERIEADTTVGAIDAAAFVRSVVDAAVTSYFKSVDAFEDAVDQLDGRALSARPGTDILADLVALRRRVARLRRVLSDQREVFAAFGSADFSEVAPGDEAAGFQAVAERFESALKSVDDSRDLLLGSFEIFMTRTAQRTNDTMKVLALATVLLLPGSLLAGLLGMNVTMPLPKDDPLSFWFVIAVIVVVAIVVVVMARVRRWI
jgi:magnesium transporter